MLENTHGKFNTSDAKISKLEKNAYESSKNATDTKTRAEELMAKVKLFMVSLGGMFYYNLFLRIIPHEGGVGLA